MPKESKRHLKAFLCHASGDKPQVRILYRRLIAEGVDAWLDQEKILPGQDWQVEIPRAVKDADVVVICLSNKSITKEGYIQKEIKFALDSADEKPKGTIFLIPARLEDCPVPDELSRWQWVDLYEDNGFVKLLRSLKLRADKVGAVIEQSSYVEEDKEIENRLDQLYTEGLAAFYTEDWDRACQRFQSILSERPNHKNATEKLEEAERQRNLSKLYAQSLDAYKLGNWGDAVKALEELSQKYAGYKDSAQLLRDARKQKQLKELYAEAKTLHVAQKWQAVIKVFEQISVVDSLFQDPDELLSSAQKEVAELERLAELNDLYRNAVREMDAGQWVEARKLLEKVHKAQTGFLETEKLLRKVEIEIAQAEDIISRNNQVNTLYEQAHGLIRSKNWRKALDKIEEILNLDGQFVDKDGISEKAKLELLHEEQDVQKQNDLASMYADAVRLLKEGRYQESLNRWQDVKAIDPKYPDRQWVQRTAYKKLTEATKAQRNKLRSPLGVILMVGGGFVVIAFSVALIVFLSSKWPPPDDITPTSVVNITPTNIVEPLAPPNDPTPTSVVIIPTNTVEPLTSLLPEFSTAKVLFQDSFDGTTLSVADWDNYLVKVSVEQGLLTLTGGNSWIGALNRSREIKENQAALFEFKYNANTEFEVEIATGEFQTPSWRVWGIFGKDQTFNINVGQGNQGVDGTSWKGNLKPSADVWYIALFSIGADGTLTTRIWERDDPSQYLELTKSMGGDWMNKKWIFGLDIFSGTLTVDTYQEITLK